MGVQVEVVRHWVKPFATMNGSQPVMTPSTTGVLVEEAESWQVDDAANRVVTLLKRSAENDENGEPVWDRVATFWDVVFVGTAERQLLAPESLVVSEDHAEPIAPPPALQAHASSLLQP